MKQSNIIRDYQLEDVYYLSKIKFEDPITGEKKEKLELYLSVVCLDCYDGNSIEEKLKNLCDDIDNNHPTLNISVNAIFTVFKSSELNEKFNLTTIRKPEDYVPSEERVIKDPEFHSHGGLFPADEQQWLNFDETAINMRKLIEEKLKKR